MVGGVPRCLHHLVREIQGPETLRIDWNQAIQIFLSDRRIAVISMSKQSQNLTEQPGAE